MSEPEKADLDEVWTALEPHIEWPEGLTLILLFADNPAPINDLRERAESLVRDSGRTLFMLAPQTVDQLSSVLGSVLVRPADQVRALWIELWRGSGGGGWDHAVGDILQRLNERRAALERVLRRPTVLVLPASFRTRVHVLAPDLWTIRSFTADLPSPPAETYVPSASELPVRPTFALPPPSAEEKEWARMLATGEHDRIDARDGLLALDAAIRRGSLTTGRTIAQQVIELSMHGVVGEDCSTTTIDDVLQTLQSLRDAGQPTSRDLVLLAALDRLGDIELQAGNIAAARSLFRRALDLREHIVQAAPQSGHAQRNLSVSLNKLGDIERQAGNLPAARDLFQRSLELREHLASADPRNRQAQRDLSVSLSELGYVELETSISAARDLFQRSLDLGEHLASTDPQNARAQRDLSVSLERLGDLELQAGNLSAARSLFLRSFDIREHLASADPHSAEAQRDLSILLDRLGETEFHAGNLSAAQDLFRRSLDICEHLTSIDPHNARTQLDCIHTHLHFIKLGERLKNAQLQREHLQGARARLKNLTAQTLVAGHAESDALARLLEDAQARLNAPPSDPRDNPP